MGNSPVAPITALYETEILIDPVGFQDHDVCRHYPEGLNLCGVNVLGMALATLIHEKGVSRIL